MAAQAYEETVEAGGEVAQAMRAFRTLIGNSRADVRATRDDGSEIGGVAACPQGDGHGLHLHWDSTASHYLKLLMDAAFHPR